jgi:hypothetical protein
VSSSTDQAADPPPPPDGGPGGAVSAPPGAAIPGPAPPAEVTADFAASAQSPGTADCLRDADQGQPASVPSLPGNRYATTALVSGILGFAVITIFAGLVFGVLGLRRAGRTGQGKVRCWMGIGFAVAWAALAGYLAPHLIQAADPGCVAYKGTALTAYRRVVADFSAGADRTADARDLDAVIRKLDEASADSRNAATARSLADLSQDLRTVRSDVQSGEPVPRSALETLNRDSGIADAACGTVRM